MKQKKVLVVTTLGYTIQAFLCPYIKLLESYGYQVDLMANWNHQWKNPELNHSKLCINFSRSLFSFKNLKAFLQIIKALKENNYNLIYTHTPISSALIRISCFFLRKKIPIIYEVHGFHFHVYGNKFLNCFFFLLEKILSYLTMAIITINQDDYKIARKKFAHVDIYYSPGIGIDTGFYQSETIINSTTKHTCFKIVTIANLIPRKNIFQNLDVAMQLKKKNINFQWEIIGDGPLKEKIINFCKQNQLDHCVFVTGFSNDIKKKLMNKDLFVLFSLQEGLPRSLLEAGAIEIPCAVMDIRGNRDLIEHKNNGFLISPKQTDSLVDSIQFLIQHPETGAMMGKKLRAKIIRKFSLTETLKIHDQIFKEYLT